MDIESIKQKLFEFTGPEASCWANEHSAACTKHQGELRKVSVDESWTSYQKYWLERSIKEGRQIIYYEKQRAKYGKYFNAIWNTQREMNNSWSAYKLLFIDKECETAGWEQIILRRALGATIEQALLRMALQSIDKLLNDVQKKTLTLRQLIKKTMESSRSVTMIAEFNRIKSLQTAIDIGTWRNNLVSHLNTEHAVGEKVLPPLLCSNIDSLIEEINVFFNKIGSIVQNMNYEYMDSKDISHQIEYTEHVLKNGLRLAWMSEISSLATGKWDRSNGTSGSLLLHPAIVEKVHNSLEMIDKMSKNCFVDVNRINPQNSETDGQLHQSPF